ncbi:MAG: penicillin-binding protein 2 [bacterium]
MQITNLKKKYTSLNRIGWISILIIFAGVLIVVRLFFLQVVHGRSYSDKADRQYSTPAGSIFERGTIYFSKKDGTTVSAATVMTGFRIAINPKKIVNPEEIFQKINAIVPLDRISFDKSVARKNDPYEEIANRISKEQADQVEGLHLTGVSLYKEKWRFYPGGTMSAQTLGFVGFDGDLLTGRYGLERSYDNTLSRSKDDAYTNPFAEIFTNISKTFFKNTNREGDIITTIEPQVQLYVEKMLIDLNTKWQPESTGIIVMDPNNGEIVAIGSLPSFNPNEYGTSSVGNFTNPMTEKVYEMGSVIKPLVMAAALDAGVVTKDTTYMDKGFVQVGDRTINNFDKKGRGKATMQTVLDQSLNTGMVFTEQQLGKEKMRDYMLAYKIGEKTGIDLPSEIGGLVSNLKRNNEVELANASFGQGIALTPVGAIRAFASIANGGILVTPHIAKEILYADTGSKVLEYPTARNALKPETTPKITEMLVHIIDKAYLEGKYSLPHYSIAGKTGTAQIALPNGGGYYDDKHMHSFFGYFPASKPRFIVYMYIRDPKGVQYAAQTLLPQFGEISKYLINYYQIPPDR